MADFKYSWNPLEEEAIQPTPTETEGIFKPTSSKEKIEAVEDWRQQFAKGLEALWGDANSFHDSLGSKKPEPEVDPELTVYDEWLLPDTWAVSEARKEAGITQSLVEGGGEAFREKLPEGTTLRPQTLDDVLDAGPVYEPLSAPPEVTEEPLDESTPATEEEATVDTDTFANIITAQGSTSVDSTTPLTAGFDSLVEAEGTDIHLDGRGFVTLPYGIVPDKGSVKKSDGTTFDPTGSHGLSSSQLSGVDYSGATKYGISRTDYDSDEAFAKAVYAEFANRTASSYGDGFAGLTDEAKQAAYDMTWNAGIGSANWSSVKTMLKEASSEGAKDKDKLIGFTTNFRSDTDYPRGLLKRRLQTYNLVANQGEEASVITTEAVSTKGVRTGTRYTVKAADGTVLKVWEKPDTNEVLGDLEVPE